MLLLNRRYKYNLFFSRKFVLKFNTLFLDIALITFDIKLVSLSCLPNIPGIRIILNFILCFLQNFLMRISCSYFPLASKFKGLIFVPSSIFFRNLLP